ncbi:hypothetical protein [Paractinoplanes durhamensis]|uniref:Uncharacterized protein n=1 Tax=Paractinoplanes durhamensis TaxID=113563 RepID=A0ABQ3YYT1_9ACTN|nr:hypothetical protein [Actinoplanes durhamensis]GIE02748.1 hypothetical protein Adu01nite_40980 [Actinoplanes durhamensis]
MTTTRITRQDLDNLAEKIAGLQLDEHETSVMLAVFALAVDSLGRTLPDVLVQRSTPGVTIIQDGPLPDLGTIFDQAFAPSAAASAAGDDDGKDDTVAVTFGKIGR